MKEEQYPKDFVEFLEQFKDEESCRQYLFELKWAEGFCCPKCKNETYWLTAQNLIHCKLCGHQTSLTAGTLFHGTRKPLLLWFHIIWWVVAQKKGVSASNMTDFMGFGTYRTAWTWLQKLRRAMVRPGRDKLSGVVEVDETFVGGMEVGTGNKGRGKESKLPPPEEVALTTQPSKRGYNPNDPVLLDVLCFPDISHIDESFLR